MALEQTSHLERRVLRPFVELGTDHRARDPDLSRRIQQSQQGSQDIHGPSPCSRYGGGQEGWAASAEGLGKHDVARDLGTPPGEILQGLGFRV